MNRRQFLLRLSAAGAAFVTGCARAVSVGAPPPGAAAPVAPVAPPAPPAPVSNVDVALVAIGGDTTLGANLQAHFDDRTGAGLSRDLMYPLYFSGLKPIFDWADLAMVNLECPFTERGARLEKAFNFRARRELVHVLTEGSIDAVTLANNHLMDFGPDGVTDTIDTLDDAKILHFGAGRDLAGARAPLIVERAGVKLGFLGYYFQDARDMREPAGVFADAHRAGVAGCYTDLACMKKMLDEDLARLIPRVDAAIPFFHWGHEGATEVRDYQIELAHQAIERGARAVLGSHPHRFQGVEVYRGAPVFYSLGNCVFGGNKDPEDKLSAIARLQVPKTGAVEADLVPFQVTRWPDAPFQPFPLELEEKTAALIELAARSLDFPETVPQLAALAAEARARRAAAAAPAGADSSWADSTRTAPH